MAATLLPLALCCLLALPACVGGRGRNDDGHPAAELAAHTWVGQVAADPASFGLLLESSSRDGWAAFHRSDFDAAADLFGDDTPEDVTGGARSLAELAALYQDLARLSDEAWFLTFKTWEVKAGLPDGSALPYAAGVAAVEAGREEEGRAWLGQATSARSEPVAEAARLLSAHGDWTTPLEAPSLPALAERFNQHLAARAGGDVGALVAAAAEPLLVEEMDGGRQRPVHDPQLLRTLAAARAHRAGERLGVEPIYQPWAAAQGSHPLAGVLFSPLPRLAEPPGADEPAILETLGLAGSITADDDADLARRQVRELDVSLEAIAQTLEADQEGWTLVEELGLLPLWRSRLLLLQARRAMTAGHPLQAEVFAQHALDLDETRAIGPVNHPGLFAILAEARLRTGRARESLDALQVLVTEYPALTGLQEVVGDLSILQGLDRHGDSKEN